MQFTLPQQTQEQNRQRVSVVIPTYCSSRFIVQTLTSVLTQNWPDLEVIVVDDGSTDDTVSLVQSFADRGVKLIRQANRGAASARNAGYRASRGDFIQFLDHDDQLHPDKISIQMQRLAGAAPGAIACCVWEAFDHTPGDRERRPERLWKDGQPLDWLIAARGGEGQMPTGAWLTPRPVIEVAGPWNEGLRDNPDDDGEFFSRVLLASHSVLFCAEAVYYYRTAKAGNLRLSRSARSMYSLLRTQQLYEKRLRSVEDSARTRRAASFGYSKFLQMTYPAHPELCDQALAAYERLGVAPRFTGSANFRRLAAVLGLKWALKFRELLWRQFARRGREAVMALREPAPAVGVARNVPALNAPGRSSRRIARHTREPARTERRSAQRV